MSKPKSSKSKKVLTALAITVVIVGLMMLFFPDKYQNSPLAFGLCYIVGSLFASIFQRSSIKKTETLKEEADMNIDILYTSRKVKKGHKVILMSKVERELSKIIHDETVGKEINKERRDVLLSLVHKYGKQGIVVDNEEIIKFIKAGVSPSSSTAEKEVKVDDKLKNHTITQLFLVSKRQELFMAKNIAIFGTALSAGCAYFYFPDLKLISLIPAFLYFVLLIKEKVLTYRVEMGFFGRNKTEAIQLLVFIEKNKDNLDLNGPGGNKRKIFKATVIEERRVPVGGIEGVYQ
ncbi:hypothetical protein [Franconibacter daqui]|uniref:hypothetical protein n=1 Tax=Franconibacter daqui TaxID=2047724 RepID=UPI002DC05018|nr:hypothetical protein [Franconibacter daqui]MEB5924631.1 hypothetical protein [Franconibacter daqui]